MPGLIQLSWTELTDSICSHLYSNKTVSLQRSFVLASSGEPATVENIAGETLLPACPVGVSTVQHGTISADRSAARPGTSVTLTVTPESGFVPGTVSVTYQDDNNQTQSVTPAQDANDPTVWTFEMPDGDVTVTGVFHEQFTYTFGPGLAAGEAITETVYDTLRYTLPECSFPAPSEGVRFQGWVSLENEAPVLYQPGEEVVVSGDKTFTARWGFTVSFLPGAGSGSMAPVSVSLESGTSFDYTLTACAFTAPTGRRFVGWSKDGAFYAPEATVTLTADAVFTAKWAAIPEQTTSFSIDARSVSGGCRFTITRSGDVSHAQTVFFQTVGRSAMGGVHYAEQYGTLTFAAGDTNPKTVTVTEYAAGDVPLLYRYQNQTYRTYSFELLDEGGFRLACQDRDINYGTSYHFSNGSRVNGSITNLVYFSGSSYASGLSSTNYYDTSTAATTGYLLSGSTYSTISSTDWRLVDDGYDYKDLYYTIPTSGLYTSLGFPKEYYAAVGDKLYATVMFDEYEGKDGFQYIQILTDNTATYDGKDGDSTVSTPSTSVYKACFIMTYKADHSADTHYWFFPHRYNDTDPGSHNEFEYSDNHLYAQAFQTDSYRASSSGSLVLSPSVSNLVVRLDANGSSDDDWYICNLRARLAIEDATKPSILNEGAVDHGPHCRNNTVTISVPFSEIVVVTGTPTLTTTWGTLSYVSGTKTNVLTFSGTITAAQDIQLRVTAISGTIKDLMGNVFATGSLNWRYADTVSATCSYPISYDLAGGTLAGSNPSTYTHESAAITLNNPTRTGCEFLGWTGTGLTDYTRTVTIPAGSHGSRYYTAHFAAYDYSISYDLAGGALPDGTANPLTYNVDSGVITLVNPTLRGWIFAGWTGTGLSELTQTVTIPAGSVGARSYTAHYRPAIDSWEALQAALNAGGEIVLVIDVTGPGTGPLTVPSGVTATLDLNGCTIDRKLTQAGAFGYVFSVEGTLILNDSVGSGVVTGGWSISDSGGVMVCARSAAPYASFTMNGGTITGCRTSESGGGVYVCNSARFTMNGGTITDNNARNNGGGVFNNGTLVLTGGAIIGNRAEFKGGGLFNDNTDSGAVSISGPNVITITGNTEENNAAADSDAVLQVTGPLHPDTRIGVNRYVTGRFTYGLPGRGSLDNFFCNIAADSISLNETGEAIYAKARHAVTVGSLPDGASCAVHATNGEPCTSFEQYYTVCLLVTEGFQPVLTNTQTGAALSVTPTQGPTVGDDRYWEFTMPDHPVTVTLERIPHDIRVNLDSNVHIERMYINGTEDYSRKARRGDTVSFVLSVNEGYQYYDLSVLELPVQDELPFTMENDVFTFTMPSNHVVVSFYSRQTCTVRFDPGNGCGTMDSMTAPQYCEITLPACTFTPPTGMVFRCWNWDGFPRQPGDTIAVRDAETTIVALYRQADGYFLIGPDWDVTAFDRMDYFTENPDNPGEYLLRTALTEGDQIKVVHVTNGNIDGWYPTETGGADCYIVPGAEAGLVTIKFRPEGQIAWSGYGGYFSIETNRDPFTAHSLTLEGRIGENFIVNLNGVTAQTLAAAAVTFTWDVTQSNGNVTKNEVTVPLSDLEVMTAPGYENCFKVPVKVSAKEMGDSVHAVLTVGGQSFASDYSVRTYAERIIANDGHEFDGTEKLAELQTLCRAMLNYGAAAQQQFGYKTGNLVSSGTAAELSAAEIAALHENRVGTLPDGITFAGTSLLLKAGTVYRLYFTAASGSELSVARNGAALPVMPKGSYWYVEIADIDAKDILTDVTLTVNGVNCVFNAGAYIKDVLNDDAADATLKNTVTALYRYCQAARAYFGVSFGFTDALDWYYLYLYALDESGNELTGSWPGTMLTWYDVNDQNHSLFTVSLPTGTARVVLSDGWSVQTVEITDFYYTDYEPENTTDADGNYNVVGRSK